MSLRKPQEEALEKLARICDRLPLKKGTGIEECLALIKGDAEAFPGFNEFEHNFPSFCFALATGVGKTRLMGAFITYLFTHENIRNFLVLAPSLTIYDKLKTDFKRNTGKYVFEGISQFAVYPPVLITGDDYEQGRGVDTNPELFDNPYINIFNISKLNSEVRGGNLPRIKRLRECIGESYFDYLAGIDDLVIIMDESHRYRAGAGMRVLHELNPVLGIELTATPQTQQGARSIPFKNVVYSYPLSEAMRDGFVKEPAVATRKDFNLGNVDSESLERLKLEDAIRLHETAKTELEVYARQTGQKQVKPFMLVVAENTAHAGWLLELIEDTSFFDGRYKGKAITVHSKQGAAEQDAMVEKLLEVEHFANPTEIVIHVNMLAEGWDVTNLYTIVPLRAANSRILVEQSIGRGLRLPYGKRTGVEAVDTLTIVSHDKFQEIIEDARRPDSIIRRGIIIGEDIPAEGLKSVTVEPVFIRSYSNTAPTPSSDTEERAPAPPSASAQMELTVQREVLKVFKGYERLSSSKDLHQPAIQREIARKVQENLTQTYGALPELELKRDIPCIVQEVTEGYTNFTIDIPRIIVVPVGEVAPTFYRDFELELPASQLTPVPQEILIQSLEDDSRRYLKAESNTKYRLLEDYLISGLMNYDDISYDDHAPLLYKLAGQMVEYLRSYLVDEEKIRNVLVYYNRNLIELIHTQMQDHYQDPNTGFEAKVSKGFVALEKYEFTIPANAMLRNIREPVPNLSEIRSMMFNGVSKSYFSAIKFDSDPERKLAVLLEREDVVLKWIKPQRGMFQIDYRKGKNYEPDFVVETADSRYLVEVKGRDNLNHPDVIAKRDAAVLWCSHAHEATGTPWRYILVPHDEIGDAASFTGLVNRFGC